MQSHRHSYVGLLLIKCFPLTLSLQNKQFHFLFVFCVSSSGHLHCDLVLIVFLQTHREAVFYLFQEFIWRSPTTTSVTVVCLFFSRVKSKVGYILTKTTDLRIDLNIDGEPIESILLTHPFTWHRLGISGLVSVWEVLISLIFSSLSTVLMFPLFKDVKLQCHWERVVDNFTKLHESSYYNENSRVWLGQCLLTIWSGHDHSEDTIKILKLILNQSINLVFLLILVGSCK